MCVQSSDQCASSKASSVQYHLELLDRAVLERNPELEGQALARVWAESALGMFRKGMPRKQLLLSHYDFTDANYEGLFLRSMTFLQKVRLLNLV